MECLIPYLCMVTVPHIMAGLESMLDYRSVGLERFHCMCYVSMYSETSLIRHSMGPEKNVGLGGCWIMECLIPYLCMVTVPHIMAGLESMLDYRSVGLERFHCMCYVSMYSETSLIRHSMGPENNVGLGGCWIMECLLPYL